MGKQAPQKLSPKGSDSEIKQVKYRNTFFGLIFNLKRRMFLRLENAQI
jgi:hypothetical protein